MHTSQMRVLIPMAILTSHMQQVSNQFSNLYNKSEPVVSARSILWYHDILLPLIKMQDITNSTCNMTLRDGTRMANSSTPTLPLPLLETPA